LPRANPDISAEVLPHLSLAAPKSRADRPLTRPGNKKK
jgi:hypothetical protein